MREAEGSGGTFFDGMSHEQMLAWLDQANAGVVSGAAERLKSAADEIEKIAGELKVRPQWVSWKGSGADAFRTWAADLAAATLHLSDFSRESGTWLGHASDSIALAQSTVPRDIPTATANLAAARAAHNDPDAAGVASKSSSELAALAADREVVRLEAASEMTKLAQSYAWSAAQLNSLERPKLPPPPKAFVPTDVSSVDGWNDQARSGGSIGAAPSAAAVHSSGESGAAGVSPSSRASGTHTSLPHVSGENLPPVRTAIDSVGTVPQQTPVDVSRGPADPGPGRTTTPQVGPMPLVPGGGPVVAQGRVPGVGRVPMAPVVQGGTGATAPIGRVPNVSGGASTGHGIVGGRPVLPSEGRPTGAIPRGTVVGGEGTPARGPMGPVGQTPGMANSVGRGAGAPGKSPAVRPVTSSGGVVGGHPAPNSGVVGGSSGRQQPGRPGTRSPSSGANGVGGTGPHNAITGGTANAVRSGEGHGATGTAARRSSATPPPNARSGNSRPYGVTEDEETWRRNQRPSVPPVID